MDRTDKWCDECNIGYEGPRDVCPRCGSTLTASSRDGKDISLLLPFSTFACEHCGDAYVPDGTGRCPKCSAPANPEDANVVARETAFGTRVDVVRAMRIQWGADALRFGRRGRRLEVQEHLSLLHAMAFDETTSMISEAISLFSTVEWRGDNSEADEVLDRLVELCTEIFFRAAAVATTPPPLALLPIHRQVARMLAQSGSALALFIETLTGSLLAEVMDTRAAAQAALDDAAKHANGIAGNFELLDRALAVTPGMVGRR